MVPPEPTASIGRKPRRSVLRWYAKNPVVGLVGTIASVIAIPLAIALTFMTIKSRELSFYINPVRTIIVRSGRSSDLHVLYQGQPVSSDVTALQVALWNAGRESIEPEHILEPIILKTDPRVPILEANIRSRSRTVTGISLDMRHLADGLVGINWRILEHDDGAVIQLIIAGPISENITASGLMKGQPTIISIGEGEAWTRSLVFSIALMIYLMAGSVILQRIIARHIDDLRDPILRWKTLILLILLMALIAAPVPIFRSSVLRDVPGTLRFDTKMEDDRSAPPRMPPDG